MHHTLFYFIVFFALGWLLFLSPFQASANDEGIIIGSEAALSGGAVTSTVSDGSALWYNPAGLGAVTRSQLDASGNLLIFRYDLAPRFLNAEENSSRAESAEVTPVPAGVTFARNIEKKGDMRLTFGLGLFVVESTNFRIQPRLSLSSGSLVSVDLDDVAKNYHAAMGLGWQPFDSLRLGFKVYADLDTVDSALTLWSSYSENNVSEDASVIIGSTSLSHLDAFGLGAGFGLQWEPTQDVKLGFSLATPRLDVGINYNVREASVRGNRSALVFEPSNDKGLVFDVASLKPMLIRLGVAYGLEHFKRGSISVDADFRLPLVDERFGVKRRFVWNIKAGARFQLFDDFALGFGFFTDLSSTRNSDIDVTLGTLGKRQLNLYGGSIGLEFGNRVRLNANERATDIRFMSTLAFKYAYGSGTILSYRVNDIPDENWITPLLTQLETHDFGLYIGSSFSF